jgi:DNA-binding CsgD family transcriptional regulator
VSGGSARSPHRRRADDLVGRDVELKTLGVALDDAAAGRGQTWFIVGDSGIGKTRLVSAVAAAAAKQGFTVAIGHASPVETGVPYAVFSDALVPVLRDLEPSVLALLTRGAGGELAQLFPALDDGRRAANASGRGDPAEVKARLLWNFARFLSRFAAKRPLLLVLENLQWADSASLEMLHFVARQLSDARVSMLCTHNDADQRGNATLRATEQSLKNIGAARRLRLDALSADDIAALLDRRFGAGDARARSFAGRLHHWTAGNPFFVDETLNALIESQQLRETPSGWSGWEVESLRVPATIRDAVLARLADLSPDARRLAELAAVVGTRIRHGELEAVAHATPDALLAAIDELRAAGILADRAEGEDIVYDFYHPIFQETLYAELGLARLRGMHASVADALERYYGPRVATHAGRLAFHYVRAGAGDDAVKAARYLRAAGADAAAKYANREAEQYLAAALDLLQRDDGAAAPRSLIEATGELARVRQRLGDYAGAMELWTRALDAARAAGDGRRVATIERSMGLARYWGGKLAPALAHYDASLGAARAVDDRPLVARVLIARASCLQAMGRTLESRAETDAALTIATELGDAGLLARAHRAALLLYLWTGPAGVARQHGREAIAFAEESGERGAAWSAHWALAMLGGLTGRAEDTRRHLAEAFRIADDLGSPLFRAWTSEVEIEYLAGTGDWDRAVAVAEETVQVARTLGQRTLLPRVLVWLGLLHLGRGDIARGKECVDEAWELAHGGVTSAEAPAARDLFAVVPAHIGRAAYAMAIGDNAKAIRIGQTGLAIADRSGNVVWTIHRLMPVIAEASLWAADMTRAKAIGERLRRESQALGQQLGLAWADACDALVELLSGDRARAVSLLAGAIDALEAIPYVPDAARMRRQLARALAETGDRDGAMRELRRAHDVFQHLGARGELDATREQMRELGARPPARSAATPGLGGLTGRELEIVRLVAARRSNKEIGTALGISARTASTHLSNIFSKLGVASRGELADYAREHGLLDD